MKREKIKAILFLISVLSTATIISLASCKVRDCAPVYKICWQGPGGVEICEETESYSQSTNYVSYAPIGSKYYKQRFGSFTIEQIR